MIDDLRIDDATVVATAFRSILPAGIRSDARTVDPAWQKELLPQELAIAGGFMPTRLAEFATGRASIRSLLRSISGATGSVLIGQRREPVLPDTVVGSITHSGNVVVTSVASAETYVGVGIDLESTGRFSDDLLSTILNDEEIQSKPRSCPSACWIARHFCGKEAAFKAMHPIIGRYIGFKDISLKYDRDNFTVAANFGHDTLTKTKVVGITRPIREWTISAAWIIRKPGS